MVQNSALAHSILNLVPIREGSTTSDAYADMIRLAQHAEKLGYTRYWIAEHHNAPSLASSATQLLIQHTLANTSTIRVGSGGVMLPNHAPYIVAEQYGTIDALYPGRVDLGLGRAPGTDMRTAHALRRSATNGTDFEQEILELAGYFAGTNAVHAYPAQGRSIPFYILGSSTYSAHLAARLGRPYAFASHFAPDHLQEAVEIYRREFTPSEFLDSPHVIMGANVVVAESDAEAEFLFTSQLAMFIGIVTNTRSPLSPPVEDPESLWRRALAGRPVHFGPLHIDPVDTFGQEKAMVNRMLAMTLKGSKETVARQLAAVRESIEIDELIATAYIFDREAELHSYELLADICS